MTGKRWGSSVPIFLLMLTLAFSSTYAKKNVYLYDESVATEIDLDTYLSTGEVQMPNGRGFFQHVEKGPAPDPFPAIAVSEQSFEQLGPSNVHIDGVLFVNHGNYYVPGKKALVLWSIRIPNASSRMASEFHPDLTLSLWVDWNQDLAWREGERMILKSLNFYDEFPTGEDEIQVFYLTSFVVPDVTEIMSSNAQYGSSDKDIRHMWSRAVLACDDPDMSPDGAQLFGEYEDYEISYLVQNSDDDGDEEENDGARSR